MLGLARLTLVLLTVLAAFVAGATSGRTLCLNHLCMSHPGQSAAGDPHGEPHNDGHHHDGEPHGSGRCLDIRSEATLVREDVASPLDHVHHLLSPALVPPVLTTVLLPLNARSPRIACAGPPPAFDDLARLGDIILLA